MDTKAKRVIKAAQQMGVPQKAPSGFSAAEMASKYLELITTVERNVNRGGGEASSYAKYATRQAENLKNSELVRISQKIADETGRYEPRHSEDPFQPSPRQRINAMIAKARQIAQRIK